MARKKTSVKLSTVLSLVSIGIILTSIFVLSGAFSSIVTTISKSRATQANPTLTESFSDAFKDDTIDATKWTNASSPGVTIGETANNNLRITIPAGGDNNKPKFGGITFNQLFPDNGDFRVVVVLYRPVVTGEGTGVSGVRFASQGDDNDEGAVLQWVVNGSDSSVLFAVKGKDGKKIESERQQLTSNVGVLRLERINKRYRAYFKPGADVSGDVGWKKLGSEFDAQLGEQGRVRLFTHNAGSGGKFPQVVGRFDQAAIRWEGAPKQTTSFNDAFANGTLGSHWKVVRPDGAQVYENPKDNLIISLPSGAMNNTPRTTLISRLSPTIAGGKGFTARAVMYKPVVVGDGVGYVGLRFFSAGNENDEAAVVRWEVGNGISRVVFVLRGPDGTLMEHAAAPMDNSVKELTVFLRRTGNTYVGSYRKGDNDADMVEIAPKDGVSLGAGGRIGLVTGNMGVGGKFPRVVGRIDHVGATIDN